MNQNKTLPFLLLVLFGAIVLKSSLYTISEWQQAIITQFGRPVGEPIRDAGLHFKLPFIQKVLILDKRILNWDGYPNQIPTKDKKYIWVDTTARWRIVSPLLFIQTVQTEAGARLRLDGILDAVTRDTIANHRLVEAVRNTDGIIGKVKARTEALAQGKAEIGAEDEITGEIEPITVGREKLSGIIIEKAREGLKEFGIEIIDVQLRRIAYETSVESKVYERMISERKRIAQKIRSVGLGEQAKIEGKINKDLKEIESLAYHKAQTIKGKADATAIHIYASAMNADPGFYEFVRTLEAYRKSIPAGSNMILSTENKFLDLLRKK